MSDDKVSTVTDEKKVPTVIDDKTVPNVTDKDSKGSEGERIYLKILGRGNDIVHHKIKKHAPFRNLMIAYCERNGIALARTRFRFNGMPINEYHTPSMLDMKDGDTIEVFQQRIGGNSSKHCGLKITN